MKSFSSWLIAIFAFMFWGVRLIGTVMVSLGNDFMFVPSNLEIEIALLFITFICICFIIKRRLLASLIYLVAHLLYYVPTFIPNFMAVINGTFDMNNYMTVFLEFIGIVLPIAVLFDLLFDIKRKSNSADKKTEWFYKDKKYNRKLDKRVDKNNYRIF